MRVLLKREDLAHTGSHKINNVLGQCLLTRRMGKQRVIAETGAGQHGVAAATGAALFGLGCTVYMGAVDVERQALNVWRMKLLGADVVPVESGSATLKDAVNEAMRGWVESVESTHYCIGSAMGPHPFPWMVREFQRVVGDEARAQTRDAARRQRSRPRRRVRRRRIERDRHVHRVRRDRRAPRRRGGRRSRARDRAPRRGGEPRRARRRPRDALAVPPGRVRAGAGGHFDQRRASTTRASVPSTRCSPPGPRRVLLGAPTTRRSRDSSCSRPPRGSSPRSSRRTRSAGSHGRPVARCRRVDGAGHAVGPGRQGRRPGCRAARRDDGEPRVKRSKRTSRERRARRPQAARSLRHRRPRPGVARRRARGHRRRRRRGRDRDPVLRSDHGRAHDPGSEPARARPRRHSDRRDRRRSPRSTRRSR